MTEMVLLGLPCYNEADNLPALLAEAAGVRARADLPLEVLAVDDGSCDGTAKVLARLADLYAAELPIHIIRHPVNLGLRDAMNTLLRESLARLPASGGVLVVMDADNSHPPAFIPDLLKKRAETGADVIIASRFRHGSVIRGVAWWRRLLSLGVAGLFKAVRNFPGVRDISCGYRLYDRGLLERLLVRFGPDVLREPSFACMVELLRCCGDLGACFAEIPFTLRYDRKIGVSKMNFRRTIFGSLRVLLSRRRTPYRVS